MFIYKYKDFIFYLKYVPIMLIIIKKKKTLFYFIFIDFGPHKALILNNEDFDKLSYV